MNGDAHRVLTCFLATFGEALPVADKLRLASDAEALLREGMDADEIAAEVQRYAQTGRAPVDFAPWVRRRRRTRAWWSPD